MGKIFAGKERYTIEFLGNLKIGEHLLTRKTFSLKEKESSLKKEQLDCF